MFHCTQEKPRRFNAKKRTADYIFELFSYFRIPRNIDITVFCSFVLIAILLNALFTRIAID